MSDIPRRWVKPRDAADHLGVTIRTLQAMRADGRITAHRLGSRTVRYDLAELDAAFEADQ